MKKLTLCEKCKEKFERGGMLVGWDRAPSPTGKKEQCQECGKKRHCGDCVVGK